MPKHVIDGILLKRASSRRGVRQGFARNRVASLPPHRRQASVCHYRF
jgi:hypothetical protein